VENIIELWENPKTPEYYELKELVHGRTFTWNYKGSTDPKYNPDSEKYTPFPIYQHVVVYGVDTFDKQIVPIVPSEHAQLVLNYVYDVLKHNAKKFTQIHRCVINQTHHWDGKPGPPHKDHYDINHNNVIIYLNSFDEGEITVIDDDGFQQSYKPMEDDIVTFPGLNHSVGQPAPQQRRIVLVFTYS